MKTKLLSFAFVASALVTNMPLRLNAMFAPYTDRDLIEKSEVIVHGEYLGETEVRLGGQTGTLWFGVVAVREVLKGNPQAIILLLAVPSPTKPLSGSDIVFRPKQEGLWLVAARPGGPAGIYVADHPQRFVPAGSGQAKVDALKKIIRDGKRS